LCHFRFQEIQGSWKKRGGDQEEIPSQGHYGRPWEVLSLVTKKNLPTSKDHQSLVRKRGSTKENFVWTWENGDLNSTASPRERSLIPPLRGEATQRDQQQQRERSCTGACGEISGGEEGEGDTSSKPLRGGSRDRLALISKGNLGF